MIVLQYRLLGDVRTSGHQPDGAGQHLLLIGVADEHQAGFVEGRSSNDVGEAIGEPGALPHGASFRLCADPSQGAAHPKRGQNILEIACSCGLIVS